LAKALSLFAIMVSQLKQAAMKKEKGEVSSAKFD